jgi:prevent-host-death family protein
MASEIGVREFKNGASRFIDRVEAGEVLTVTRRGKPVATVMPAGMPAGLARMIAEGRVRWSGRKPTFPEPIRLRGDGPLASDYVLEGRR